MHVAVVTSPADIVSLEQVKAHLQVEHNAYDAIIGTYVAAAIQHLDGPEGYLRRAVGQQVLKATVYEFPTCRDRGLLLPYPPVSLVNDIEYISPDGSEVEVDPEIYELTPEGRLRLAYGMSWPSRRSARDPVSITFTAGWEVAPAPIVTAVLMHVTAMYDRRDEGAEFPEAAKRLVSRLRIRRV